MRELLQGYIQLRHSVYRGLTCVWCMAGEILVGPKKVFLLDEPTTGLDSSTAYHIVRTIRDFAHMEGVSGPHQLVI